IPIKPYRERMASSCICACRVTAPAASACEAPHSAVRPARKPSAPLWLRGGSDVLGQEALDLSEHLDVVLVAPVAVALVLQLEVGDRSSGLLHRFLHGPRLLDRHDVVLIAVDDQQGDGHVLGLLRWCFGGL